MSKRDLVAEIVATHRHGSLHEGLSCRENAPLRARAAALADGGGRNAAHGSNPKNADKTLSEMLISGADGDASVGTKLGADFAQAALDGGGYVAYQWAGAQKVSYVVGVRRFGQHYYVGVGVRLALGGALQPTRVEHGPTLSSPCVPTS